MMRLTEVVSARVRSGRGFLDRFEPAQALVEVRAALPRGASLAAESPYRPLWVVLDAATTVEDVLSGLGLASGDLEGASAILRTQEEAARRKKRSENIAGVTFDTAAENLVKLYDHIRAGIPSPTPLDLTGVSVLAPVGKRRRDPPTGRDGRTPGGRGRGYSSQESKNAIALAGEIHAYRWLQATYGAAVGPECWLSSLAQHVFPANVPEDGAGCDFRLRLPGKGIILHLEVKATHGLDEAFEMGSSEIALARELAMRRRRKKEWFRVLHILDVYSTTPIPVVLPNPYDPDQDVFRIDEAGVRMRYRRIQPDVSAK